MFKPYYGRCVECKQDRIIVVKKGYCKLCNERSKGKSTTNGIKRTVIKKKAKKVTGEAGIFVIIWAERKHVCQCCGHFLGDDPTPGFFSHILSKGAMPSLRLDKRNIMLMCHPNGCHAQWDFGDKSQEKFKLARMIAEKLKRMYYGNDNADDIDPGIHDQPSEGFSS